MGEEKVVKVGAKLKVGIEGFANPTPLAATYAFRFISACTLIWAIIQHMDLGLTPEVTAKINEWAVAALPICHVISKSFGWKLPDSTNN